MSRSTSRSSPRNAYSAQKPGQERLERVTPRVARLPRVTELDDRGQDDDDDFLDEDGKFAKGHEKRGGRKKGQQNKMTRDLKHATLRAAEMHGSDGEGLDGLIGYLFFLAKTEPKSFAPLLGRMIPLHIGGSVDHTHRVLRNKDEVIEELKKRGLLIEGVYERLEDWTPAQDDESN